ncbi:heterodimeric methylmalonyl-CoA mutase small subunit [Tenacibaculum adriaticum]|uniref:Heterodimeric methylmalonyl-CoA mutase small subunit n=1 Tax=Tenacibaculum adriaticum TaxID=413713 RepID=A0A5S5DNS8_9FLAO|nr:methylmalonyl-CoA mutase subunit beta [Tenacibaculum adriaticum]TYP97375.1 heterodimeric methylmalonyl-CoA mutase small subunit [Tenacibaculum adriaticum]
MSNYLFDEFENVTPKAWKQKIQADLKGADYNETLLWKTEESITVKPFYTKEDRTHQEINLPKSGFNICQSIFIDDEKVANQLAIDALKRGATAIEFTANSDFDYKKILKNIDATSTKIYFKLNFLSEDFVLEISKFINSKNCFFNIDIIGNLAKTGNWFSNLKEDHNQLEKIISFTNNCIGVNVSTYQNAGATNVQQLAYALAHANEYLNHFGESIASKIHFNFSIGSNYFFEIAKLRTFRILWNSLLKEYGIKNTSAHIFAQPSLRNKTLYDYNVNMLRTTSECMSAILGGANTVSNVSYDEIFHKSNEFGERISRNQLLILQQESELAEAQNIANGTYYIESITEQLAEKALEIFKLIENGGGFLKQLKEGIIQRKIAESAEKEQTLFDNEDLVLLGTNKIRNEKDKMKNDLELFPFVKKRVEKTLIQPIIQKRLAEKLEQERLSNE